jgi:septal ring factor EnvC (AmiA/AmiB activator)
MSDVATRKDIERVEKKIDKAVEDLSNIIAGFAQQVDDRFRQVEKRLDKLEASIDRLTNSIDGLIKRYNEMEVENAARDAQFARLVEWAKKVSAKTGIPLENL